MQISCTSSKKDEIWSKRISSSGSWLHQDTIETVYSLFKETSFLLFGPLAKILATRWRTQKLSMTYLGSLHIFSYVLLSPTRTSSLALLSKATGAQLKYKSGLLHSLQFLWSNSFVILPSKSKRLPSLQCCQKEIYPPTRLHNMNKKDVSECLNFWCTALLSQCHISHCNPERQSPQHTTHPCNKSLNRLSSLSPCILIKDLSLVTQWRHATEIVC